MADDGMGTNSNSNSKDALAQGLGWFSVGLGLAQLAAPRGLARAIGLRGGDDHGRVMRVMGARELATGAAILARPRPAAWLWARVAGDALDLALLAKADSKERRRVAAVMAAVAGVTIPDVVEGMRLARRNGSATVTRAVTINRPRGEVEQAWADSSAQPDVLTVRFAEAPGDRGTEVVVELPSGEANELGAGLRRFKQVVETGEVVRSDAVVEARGLRDYVGQRPAQPQEVAR
jgi:hypothetical protein